MMRILPAFVALASLTSFSARAQNVKIVPTCAAESLTVSPPLGQVFYMDQTGLLCTPSGGGGGGGGAATIANGADVTQGAVADAAAASGGTGTTSAKLRQVTALLQSILTGPLPVSNASLPLPTGAATSAKQPAIGTAGTPSADVASVQGVAGGTPMITAPNIKTITWIAPTSASITTSGTVVAAGPAVSVITNATAAGGGVLTLNLFGGTAVANVGIPLQPGASATVSGQPVGTAVTGICSTGPCTVGIQSGS
jgi:hypothetical protein